MKASEETLQKQKDTSSRELEEKNRTISKMEDDHNAEIKALYKQIAYLHDQPVRKHPRLDSGSSMSYQTWCFFDCTINQLQGYDWQLINLWIYSNILVNWKKFKTVRNFCNGLRQHWLRDTFNWSALPVKLINKFRFFFLVEIYHTCLNGARFRKSDFGSLLEKVISKILNNFELGLTL